MDDLIFSDVYWMPNEVSNSPVISPAIEFAEDLCVWDKPGCSGRSRPDAGRAKTPRYGSQNVSVAHMEAFSNPNFMFEHMDGCNTRVSVAASSDTGTVTGPTYEVPFAVASPSQSIADSPQGIPFSESDIAEFVGLMAQSSASTSTTSSVSTTPDNAGEPNTMALSTASTSTTSSVSTTAANAGGNSAHGSGARAGGARGRRRVPTHYKKRVTVTTFITDEEKSIMVAGGYAIPQSFPLTPDEEKLMKLIRRKARNKKSAMQSRENQKNYMRVLEIKVEKLTRENLEFKRRYGPLFDYEDGRDSE